MMLKYKHIPQKQCLFYLIRCLNRPLETLLIKINSPISFTLKQTHKKQQGFQDSARLKKYIKNCEELSFLTVKRMSHCNDFKLRILLLITKLYFQNLVF